MSGGEALLGGPMHIRDSSQREALENVARDRRLQAAYRRQPEEHDPWLQTAARLAAEAASAEQLSELYGLIERQRRMQRAGNRDCFHEADEAFHAAIAESAGHPGIWTLIQQVKIQVDRYRRLTLPVPGRMARVLQEHMAIVKAIEARDPARAAAAMAAHLDGLSASIADVRDLNPEYFVEDLRPALGGS